MANQVILTADSTCDLSETLKRQYGVRYYPYHILLDGKEYRDNVDIFPDDLYRAYREKHLLPKTAAIGMTEYADFFRPWVEQGCDVIHFNLGSGITAAHQNCVLAAQELGHVYPIDSCSLSTGTGHLVIEAAERIAAGMPAAEICREIQALIPKVHASFILDTLEFMHAGGRCSSVAALGANLLKLKPCIEVSPARHGAMAVGKKYRGSLEKVLPQYVEDQLNACKSPRLDRIFITHSGISEERIQLVRREVERRSSFRQIYVTRASCTISCHCGPNTLGILFLEE